MDLARGYRANNGIKVKELDNAVKIRLNSNVVLIIKLHHSRVLRIMSRSLFLATILLTLPLIDSIIRGPSNAMYDSGMDDDDLASFLRVPILFRDLADEGLLRRDQKGLILGSDSLFKDLEFLRDNDNGLVVIQLNLEDNNSIPNHTLDFVFSFSFSSISSIDRVLKIGGIMITRLKSDPSNMLQRLPNYRLVYLRRFEETIMVAMWKVGFNNASLPIPQESQ